MTDYKITLHRESDEHMIKFRILELGEYDFLEECELGFFESYHGLYASDSDEDIQSRIVRELYDALNSGRIKVDNGDMFTFDGATVEFKDWELYGGRKPTRTLEPFKAEVVDSVHVVQIN